MDLRELRYFRAIAECGTFSRAAARLNVAQPALSRQVKKLEHELGVELLRRNTRGVVPTEAGRALLQRTASLEQDLGATRRYVSAMAARMTGTLSVAVQSPVSLFLLPQLVKEYRSRYPGVTLHLREGYSGDIMEAMIAGQVDIAIVDKPSHPHVDLVARPLWIETFSLVGPPGAPATSREPGAVASFADLAQLAIIVPSRRHVVRRLLDAAFERRSLKFQPLFEADGALMIFEMVKEGLGYTVMPNCTCHPFVTKGELSSIPIRPAIRRPISIVTRAALDEDRVVTAFRAMVSTTAPTAATAQRFGPLAFYKTAPQPEAGSPRGTVT